MPASSPAIRCASSARAVSAITGVSARPRSSLKRSMPSASGSPRSSTTSAGFTSSKSARASRAGGRVLDDVPRVAQVQRDQFRDRRVVLDDDDPRGSAHAASISSAIVAPMPLKLATILAHPDDETFGTGGTLIRYAREGIEVHSLCLTEGEKGWAGVDDAIVPRELVGPTRARELAEAGRRMGATSVTCLRYPDGASPP